MRKVYTVIICVISFAFAYGQQDAMFTKYMFNSLAYNPAYAGSKDHMAISLLHRTQWWGIDGGPSTQTFTIHSPLKNDRVGLGFSVVNDAIGPTNALNANVSYAYRIPLGKARLAVGLQGGVINWRADWSKLNLDQAQDDAFSEMSPNYLLPNFGGGLYFSTDNFYLGAGVPHLLEYDLREEEINTAQWAKQYRHYFFNVGAAIPVKGDAIIFKPSMMIKSVGLFSSSNKDEAYQNIGAPTEFDIDVSFFFYKTLWVGASFRSAVEAITNNSSSFDSVDFWAAYYLTNGLRIGAAYDYTLTNIQSPAQGSFEIMLGYEFDYVTKNVVNIRYF